MKIFCKIFFFIFFFTYTLNLHAEKITIVYAVENDPITSVDIKNEIIYLKLINKEIESMDDESLVIYASKSILREKIKEQELSKYFKFNMNNELVLQNLQKLISSMGLNNENELKIVLKDTNLNLNFIKKKIEIELLWNRLIYEKYKDKLSINEDKIKENLKLKIINEKQEIEEYQLSEILFNTTSKTMELEEIQKIKKSIDEIGFENTASIYSVSNTAGMGGNIGWLAETQLSENILEIIQNLNAGEISKVIDAPAGKLILFLKNKRKTKKELSLENELEKAILMERNKQLNQFSSIYFKKVELNTKINEK
tara:strand:- start:556 stop:1491 length:936 start_codon:yes stop_codon:yes gene_type:complete